MTIAEFIKFLEKFPKEAEVEVPIGLTRTGDGGADFQKFQDEEFLFWEFVDYSTNPLVKQNHPYFGKKVLFLGEEK